MKWELWLGKRRSKWFALFPMLALAISIIAAFIADLFGHTLPAATEEIFSFLAVATGIGVTITASVYALLAAVVVLTPAWLILVFGIQEIETETWYWVVTALTTIIGSAAIIRYSRIWKMYRI